MRLKRNMFSNAMADCGTKTNEKILLNSKTFSLFLFYFILHGKNFFRSNSIEPLCSVAFNRFLHEVFVEIQEINGGELDNQQDCSNL